MTDSQMPTLDEIAEQIQREQAHAAWLEQLTDPALEQRCQFREAADRCAYRHMRQDDAGRYR